MSLHDAVTAFARGDAADWSGLPDDLTVAELAAVVEVDTDDLRPGALGDPPRACGWVTLPGGRYAEGLRAWIEDDHVLALEGLIPVDDDDEPPSAPYLGDPELSLEAVLGPLVLRGGERVFASRGLAVRVNPRSGALLGLVGFAPTTVEDYRTRLRPVQQRFHPLTTGRSS